MIRVGPAGWSYADWEGRVYPKRRPRGFHPLRFLSEFVDCVEVNSTFYAQPRPENASRWCKLVESKPEFAFAVKLYQRFTHEPEPEDESAWEREAATFRAGIAPMVRKKKLSAVLVQFPVSFLFQPVSVQRLGRLRTLFDGLPLVLEARHQSWFSPPGLDTVRGLGYSLAHVDLPPAWNHPPTWHEATGPIGYLRLHGRNSQQWFRKKATRDDRYDYLYSTGELEGLARRAKRLESVSEQTFIITNNHFAGKAMANALDLLFMLRGHRVPAPAELVHSYPHLEPTTRAIGQGDLFG